MLEIIKKFVSLDNSIKDNVGCKGFRLFFLGEHECDVEITEVKQIDYNGNYEYSDEVLVSNPAPIDFALHQNYPNPFNPVTTIRYNIPIKSQVKLDIYNTLGEKVKRLVNEEKKAGQYSIDFNAEDVASGVYFYRLQAGDFIQTKKMVLLR